MATRVDRRTWRPGPKELERSRLHGFCRAAGCDDLDELDRRALADPAWFWRTAWGWLGLDWQAPPRAFMAGLDRPASATWFPGGRCNLAANAVDRWLAAGRGAEPAIVWEDEAGETGAFTFAGLAAEVRRVAGGLAALGVGVGDRVGLQLPMAAEAAVAQLACAHLGAIAVPIFSGFGVGAIVERLRLAGARAHIVAEGYLRRGRVVALREVIARASDELPDLDSVVVVSPGAPVAGPRLRGEVAWETLGGDRDLPAAELLASHPLLLAFTSGTTGAPKGAVLTHAGFAVKAGTDAAWCFDLGRDDVATWITDPGWIMAPITVLGGLLAGSAVALYGGAVDWPNAGRLWRVVDRLGVTMLGVSPTLVRSLMAAGAAAVPPARSRRLRVLASSGEMLTTDAYRWLFDHVGDGALPIINYSGGTEVSGAILTNTTCEAIAESGFARPVPGMAADVAGESGASVRGGVGELVLRRPSPGMTDGFWAPGGARVEAGYWSRWPDTWVHGDWAEVDDDGTWHIRGRSDDTLKIAGKRLGPAEVEAAVNAHPDVVESAAIGVPDAVKGEGIVVFARTRDGAPAQQPLRDELDAFVAAALGRALRPKAVLFVDDLPRTRSGKILRRLVRATYLGEPHGDVSALEDAAAIDAVRRAR